MSNPTDQTMLPLVPSELQSTILTTHLKALLDDMVCGALSFDCNFCESDVWRCWSPLLVPDRNPLARCIKVPGMAEADYLLKSTRLQEAVYALSSVCQLWLDNVVHWLNRAIPVVEVLLEPQSLNHIVHEQRGQEKIAWGWTPHVADRYWERVNRAARARDLLQRLRRVLQRLNGFVEREMVLEESLELRVEREEDKEGEDRMVRNSGERRFAAAGGFE